MITAFTHSEMSGFPIFNRRPNELTKTLLPKYATVALSKRNIFANAFSHLLANILGIKNRCEKEKKKQSM